MGTARIEEVWWLVVQAQCLNLQKKEIEGCLRSCALVDVDVPLIVNHLVWFSRLKFSEGKGGPQSRMLRRQTLCPVLYIYTDSYHTIKA